MPNRTRAIRLNWTDDMPTCEPLRVLSISVSGQIGGAERSLLELAAALPTAQIELHACVPPESPLLSALQNSDIAAHPIAMRRFRRTIHPILLAGQIRALHGSAREIAHLCRELNVDLLHANTNSAELLAWEAARISRVPHVWHCRDMTPLHGFARILSSSAAGIIAISGAVEAYLRNEGVRAAKVRRIDNGIDLRRLPSPQFRSELRQQVRTRMQIEAERPVLLSVGAFVPWKRHELFLETLARLRLRFPTLIGWVAGSDQQGENPEYVASLQTKIRELRLDGVVQLLCERDDVPELMAAADLLVSCSENEPFGRVLVEAGAAGLPAVSTDSGAKGELIENTVTGLLTPPGDAAALADACRCLLEDAPLRERLGQAARKRAEQLYDIRRTAREVTTYLHEVAATAKEKRRA